MNKNEASNRFAIHRVYLFDQSDNTTLGNTMPLLKDQPFYIQFLKFSDNSYSPFEGFYLNVIDNTQYYADCNSADGRLRNLLGYWNNAENWITSTFILKSSLQCQNCLQQLTSDERSNLCP